jgi:lipid II:glycine glycyltransferase (peptidoglycan interpeptide bridge formation enzyme)
MRDLGTPVYPKKLFTELLAQFPSNSFLSTCTYNDEIISAGLTVGFKETAEIIWAAAKRKYNKLSPNMLLYWETMQEAQKRGYQTFDFGRCSKDSGTYRFKKQWPTQEIELNWRYMANNIPDINPKSSKFELATSLWSKLPLCVSNRIGPFVTKHLP